MSHSNQYIPRIVDEQVERYLTAFGAVCIEGTKWCGKTWTAREHAHSEIALDDPARNYGNRRTALMDPELALEGKKPRLIDEWQEVPSLWDAVRHYVDHHSQAGQFLLTGSVTLKNKKAVRHSGAGRIARLRMRPMSLYESGESTGAISLGTMWNDTVSPCLVRPAGLRDLAMHILRGGWPYSLGSDESKYLLYPKMYLEAVMHHDMDEVDEVHVDFNKMWRLLRSLARNESTTATNMTLLKDMQASDGVTMDPKTLSVYLDLLERLFLTDDQTAFSPRLRSSLRVRQANKHHFVDPSLAGALLGATPDRLVNDLETMGFLFEALCERDLRIYSEAMGARMYHYQDYRNREIDAVVEMANGSWGAFEIKLGAHQIDTAAENLLALKADFMAHKGNAPSVLCVICGLVDSAYKRSDGVFVVPITALGP